MPAALRHRPLDLLIPLLVGAVVFSAAAGSSSVAGVTRVGRDARWVALAALLVASAAWLGPRLRLPGAALVATGSFVGLALLSTLWSVAPRTSGEHAVSLGLLFAACLLLAAAAAGRPARMGAILGGVIGGATAVGLVGLLLLVVDRHRAVQAATYEAPARFQGLGQNPNTVALLFAVVMPAAIWNVLVPGSRNRKLVAWAIVALLGGTIVASGSRGGLLAAAVGAAVVGALSGRRRWLALGAICVALAAGGAIQSIPKASASGAEPAPAATAIQPKARAGYLDAEATYPLDADVGQPLPGGGQPPVRRGLFAASGRLDAWRGALHQAALRPVAGHGFGTEQIVFDDRYYRFVGGLPENSYIGLGLQLGIAGLAALAALVATLAAAGARALRGPRRDLASAGLGVLAAGLAIAVVQSYLYSVGNIATAALWISAFVLLAAERDV